MAITWTPIIEVVDLTEDRVKFSAVRYDDVLLETLIFTAGVGVVTTNAHKLAMEDTVWAKYQAYLTHKANVATKIGNWMDDAKINLEAKET